MKKMLLPFPPNCFEDATQRFKGQYLNSTSYDQLVKSDLMGVDAATGDVHFLFLRNRFRPEITRETWKALARLPYYEARSSRRLALRGGGGSHVMMGWYSDTNGLRRQVGATKYCPLFYQFQLIPLLNSLSSLVAEYLPGYWKGQVAAAQANGKCRIGAERWNQAGATSASKWPLGRREKLPSIFSTVTINRNVICRSHADGNNGSGMSCLMAFGKFIGGYLCFPRLRLAFDVQPGDVLLADTNREQHGNIGPLFGERISLVCYLRDLMEKK